MTLTDKKRESLKNSFTNGRLFFEEKKDEGRLQDSNIFARSAAKREQGQVSNSSVFEAARTAANSQSFSGAFQGSIASKIKNKDSRKYTAEDIIRLQDFLVDAHEQEFNSFSNE